MRDATASVWPRSPRTCRLPSGEHRPHSCFSNKLDFQCEPPHPHRPGTSRCWAELPGRAVGAGRCPSHNGRGNTRRAGIELRPDPTSPGDTRDSRWTASERTQRHTVTGNVNGMAPREPKSTWSRGEARSKLTAVRVSNTTTACASQSRKDGNRPVTLTATAVPFLPVTGM